MDKTSGFEPEDGGSIPSEDTILEFPACRQAGILSGGTKKIKFGKLLKIHGYNHGFLFAVG